MSKTKNQTVKLNKVTVNVKPAANNDVPKIDLRHNNPGRPVNKKSARYKRLAKQAKYARALSRFTQGSKFNIDKESNHGQYKFSTTANDGLGCIVDAVFGHHVCNVKYIGRTKVTGYAYVLNKRVNVEVNLKTVQFVK